MCLFIVPAGKIQVESEYSTLQAVATTSDIGPAAVTIRQQTATVSVMLI